jgi:hypothetical protein
MDEIVKVDFNLPSPFELGNLSTQTLRSHLAQSLTMTAKHLKLLSLIWAELEKRGEDLSDLRIGLAPYMSQIAAGLLDAEAVIRFAGQPTVLKSVALLPLEKQRNIALGEPVEVLTSADNGKYESVKLPAYTLTGAQARQVFSGEKIRSLTEQLALVESSRMKSTRRVAPGPQNRVRYDKQADVLRIGRASATIGEVMAALTEGAEYDQDDIGQADIQINFRITERQKRQIRIRAAEAGLPIEKFLLKLVCKYARISEIKD